MKPPDKKMAARQNVGGHRKTQFRAEAGKAKGTPIRPAWELGLSPEMVAAVGRWRVLTRKPLPAVLQRILAREWIEATS